MSGDSDSDAPEELTAEEGIRQDEELRKIQRESEIRVVRESKERRRQWAQRKTVAKSGNESVPKVAKIQQPQEGPIIPGMLPSSIVDLLAAHEKKTFSSDSEEEIVNHKPTSKKKKQKNSGPETVLLKEIPPAQCQLNSMEFLKRRKMQVPRSSSVLRNSSQALRLLSSKWELVDRS